MHLDIRLAPQFTPEGLINHFLPQWLSKMKQRGRRKMLIHTLQITDVVGGHKAHGKKYSFPKIGCSVYLEENYILFNAPM